MIKNKIARIIYLTAYCVLGLIGFIGTLGYFKRQFNYDFYLYYTNLSNYLCWGLMLITLVLSVKNYHRTDQPLSPAPCFKFMCVIMIMVTCLVYNFLLASEYGIVEYFLSLSNLLNHLILPIMFILDWVLFYQHNLTRWYYPLLCVIMPLIYVIYIVVRAKIIGNNTTALLYPYFFLDINTLGIGGFITWLVILIAVFVAIGYILYLFDNIKRLRTFISNRTKNPDTAKSQ